MNPARFDRVGAGVYAFLFCSGGRRPRPAQDAATDGGAGVSDTRLQRPGPDLRTTHYIRGIRGFGTKNRIFA